MIKISLLFTALISIYTIASPVSAQSLSANTLLKGCLNKEENAVCTAYINGALSGMQWSSDVAAFNSGFTEPMKMRAQAQVLFGACVPQEATGNQLYEVILKYIQNRPKDWHEPAISLIHRAIVDAYPCK